MDLSRRAVEFPLADETACACRKSGYPARSCRGGPRLTALCSYAGAVTDDHHELPTPAHHARRPRCPRAGVLPLVPPSERRRPATPHRYRTRRRAADASVVPMQSVQDRQHALRGHVDGQPAAVVITPPPRPPGRLVPRCVLGSNRPPERPSVPGARFAPSGCLQNRVL
jgi:hypothetical protein